MIFELLPLLRGLEEDIFQIENQSLNPGEKVMWTAEYPGWATWIEFYTNHRGYVMTNALIKQPINFTFWSIMRQGLTAENAEMWITVYDDPTTRYMLIYGPRPWYKAVRRDDYFQVQAPTVDPATGAAVAVPTTINLFRVRFISIIDELEFKRSLAEILGVADLPSKIDLLNENVINLTVTMGGTPVKPPEEKRPPRPEGLPPPREEPEEFDPSVLAERRRRRGGY